MTWGTIPSCQGTLETCPRSMCLAAIIDGHNFCKAGSISGFQHTRGNASVHTNPELLASGRNGSHVRPAAVRRAKRIAIVFRKDNAFPDRCEPWPAGTEVAFSD